jgi:hypothetical protein
MGDLETSKKHWVGCTTLAYADAKTSDRRWQEQRWQRGVVGSMFMAATECAVSCHCSSLSGMRVDEMGLVGDVAGCGWGQEPVAVPATLLSLRPAPRRFRLHEIARFLAQRCSNWGTIRRRVAERRIRRYAVNWLKEVRKVNRLLY